MAIAVGDRMPAAKLLEIGDNGPQEVPLESLIGGRKVALFGMPGAYTGTCTGEHIPSLISSRDAFAAQGIDTMLVVVVNDPFVADAWSQSTGAGDAGIRILTDPTSAFVTALGLNFDAPPVGFIGRSKRFAAILDDGVVKALNVDEPGTCSMTSGEALLKEL
ncbi:MAG: peroxiredoxin [Pseudomonadota bacterium]